MMKGLKTVTYRQRLKNRGLFSLTRGKFEGLKLAAFLCVKSSILSYCPVRKGCFATREMWVGYCIPVQEKTLWHKWGISDTLDMLNPMSLSIMPNAIPRELSCWDYACLDPYLSPHRAQHPQQMELLVDSWERPRMKNDLHWMWMWSSALLNAKLMCGLT